MSHPEARRIAAIVAAAGRSTRMGSPKQLLPWGRSTVLGVVLANLAAAGAEPVICVAGHGREALAEIAGAAGAELVFNPDYAATEMLASYQCGVRYLRAHHPDVCGALFALGDQPHIPVDVIRQIHNRALAHPDAIVIPSHAMRRGHPIYLPVGVWAYLLDLGEDESLRDVLRAYASLIEYVTVDTDAILRDMDTPADYARLKDEAGR